MKSTIRKIKRQSKMICIKVECFMRKITCSHCIQDEYSDLYTYVNTVALARRTYNLTTHSAYLRLFYQCELNDDSFVFICTCCKKMTNNNAQVVEVGLSVLLIRNYSFDPVLPVIVKKTAFMRHKLFPSMLVLRITIFI